MSRKLSIGVIAIALAISPLPSTAQSGSWALRESQRALQDSRRGYCMDLAELNNVVGNRDLRYGNMTNENYQSLLEIEAKWNNSFCPNLTGKNSQKHLRENCERNLIRDAVKPKEWEAIKLNTLKIALTL